MRDYPFVQAYTDLGLAQGPRLAMVWHMAEGGNTVVYLAKPNPNGVSVHFVIEYTGRIVQMLRLSHMHTSIRTSDIRLTDDTYPDPPYGRSTAVRVLGEWSHINTSLGPNHATIAVEVEGFAKDGPNAKQREAIKALAEDLGITAHLGHRDFADYKACPGKKFPWDELGGHGSMAFKQLPITSTVPHMVDIPYPVTHYDLDGSVISTGHTAQVDVFSPYSAKKAPDDGFFAIYAGPAPIRLILTKPSAFRPIPPAADCSKQDAKIAEAIAVLEA